MQIHENSPDLIPGIDFSHAASSPDQKLIKKLGFQSKTQMLLDILAARNAAIREPAAASGSSTSELVEVVDSGREASTNSVEILGEQIVISEDEGDRTRTLLRQHWDDSKRLPLTRGLHPT